MQGRHAILRIWTTGLLLATTVPALANNINIDFTSYAAGTPVSLVDGVRFSLNGPGTSIPFAVTGQPGEGLLNSGNFTSLVPYNLVVQFTSGTGSGLSFTFNNLGDTQATYAAFDPTGTLLSEGSLAGSLGPVTTSLTGVSDIQTLVFSDSWNFEGQPGLFALQDLQGDPMPTPTPAPASLPLMLAGLGGLGLALRRRNTGR